MMLLGPYSSDALVIEASTSKTVGPFRLDDDS